LLLSQTGFAAAAGRGATIGIKIAVDEINASGGLLGRQIELVPADDQGDTNAGLSEALRLTTVTKVDFLLGPQLSQVAIAIAPTVNNAGVLWLTTTSAGEKMTPSYAPRHFSLLYSGSTQGLAYANTMLANGWKKFAIMSDDGSASQSATNALKALLKDKGLTLTGEQTWHTGDTDMTPQALAIKRTNPDVVILSPVAGKDGGYALKAIDDIGWKPPIIGSGAFTTQPAQAQEISGPEPLKRVVALLYTGMSACPSQPIGSSPYAQLLVKLKKAEPQNWQQISSLNVASGYDWVTIIKLAATATKSLNGEKLAEWIEQNAASMKLIYSPVRASKTDHSMLGPESLTPGTDVAHPREDGLTRRLNCS
jgi:ABC-type branched-subunit amino acid transport system substrate-binding protein